MALVKPDKAARGDWLQVCTVTIGKGVSPAATMFRSRGHGAAPMLATITQSAPARMFVQPGYEYHSNVTHSSHGLCLLAGPAGPWQRALQGQGQVSALKQTFQHQSIRTHTSCILLILHFNPQHLLPPQGHTLNTQTGPAVRFNGAHCSRIRHHPSCMMCGGSCCRCGCNCRLHSSCCGAGATI